MGFGTVGGGGYDWGRNDCGIATSHAYSIIDAFVLTVNGTPNNVLLSRNPWGTTDYNGAYKHDAAMWTSATIAYVPFCINPTTSHN